MSEVEPAPEADRVEGAPHPRETVELFGQDQAEAEFLRAHAAGRLHHAWMLTGPRGIGKATLAWRIARFLAAEGAARDAGGGLFGDAPSAPATLAMDPGHPVFRRVAALAEPGVTVCRREWDEKAKRFRAQLTVDEVRKLRGFFALSAAEGGWRIAIVDAADEMNTAAANALLKILEEPPARAMLLLVCHQPARLLPTIRSRCRLLRLEPLGEEDLARALGAAGAELDDALVLHRLTGGSPGDAIRLIAEGGTELYGAVLQVLGTLPRLDRAAVIGLAAGAAGRGNEARYALLCELTLRLLARVARAGAGGATDALVEAEAALVPRLAGTASAARGLADLHQDLSARTAHARAVNLDPEHVILDMFLAIEKAAGRTAGVPG